MRITIMLYTLLFFSTMGYCQDSLNFFSPATVYNKNRFGIVAGTQVTGYGGSLFFLSKAWYQNYRQTSFYFFDDGKEWQQMDKAGHLTTCWYLGKIGIDMMNWSGVSKRRTIWYGTAGSFLYLTGIELLDGFSGGWGFSWRDLSANTIGTGFIIGQKFIQQSSSTSPVLNGIGEVSLKFSYSRTKYPAYRPNILGSTSMEKLLKDYNGQTYWLSVNIYSFLNEESRLPKWLNLAVGYGAEGMISGLPDQVFINEQGDKIEFERFRQYYFSVDVDLTKIKTKSHFLKTVFEVLSIVKVPAPTLELNKHGIKFHTIGY